MYPSRRPSNAGSTSFSLVVPRVYLANGQLLPSQRSGPRLSIAAQLTRRCWAARHVPRRKSVRHSRICGILTQACPHPAQRGMRPWRTSCGIVDCNLRRDELGRARGPPACASLEQRKPTAPEAPWATRSLVRRLGSGLDRAVEWIDSPDRRLRKLRLALVSARRASGAGRSSRRRKIDRATRRREAICKQVAR
jgi:hypothetical protein